MPPVYRWLALSACSLGLLACSDFQERLGGYPTTDTVLHLDSASSNQIADALNQLSRIAVLGDDWEFLDPQDPCTMQVIDQRASHNLVLNLRGARFALHRDAGSGDYYATLQHGDTLVRGPDQQPLRLFETSSYQHVFFAEGYLQALAQKCALSLAAAAPANAAQKP